MKNHYSLKQMSQMPQGLLPKETLLPLLLAQVWVCVPQKMDQWV